MFLVIKIRKIDNRLNISHIKIHDTDSFIMLGDIDKTLMNNEFSQYINLVVNGTLYEFLEERFSFLLGETFANHMEVKTVVFQVLFTYNKFLRQEEMQNQRRCLRRCFHTSIRCSDGLKIRTKHYFQDYYIVMRVT